MNPFISICIPAYKRVDFLERLLDSIAIQEFRDFEVIITDDSPGPEVGDLVNRYHDRFNLVFHRNEQALGTPGNWNAAMQRARGAWIKLMHDDDWFRDKDSLGTFVKAIQDQPGAGFFFSAYTNVFLEKNTKETVHANASRLKQLSINPLTLFASNVIGPPSVVIHRNNPPVIYDGEVKWVVDIEFYVRFLKEIPFHYIDTPLVNVGIGKEQVTQDCFRQRQVEIPEAFYLFNKAGWHHLHHILVYDGWWRLLRNLEIRAATDITESGYEGDIPRIIRSMILAQRRVPRSMLRKGVISKTLMFLHYIANKKRLS